MFTGIIEELGTISAIEKQSDALRLTVTAELVLSDAKLGDSIAVNGCCLTVASQTETTFTADVMAESLAKTTTGIRQVGDRVNLERAVTPATRLGGHIVQGHVDGIGKVLQRTPGEHWEIVRIQPAKELLPYLVSKGSVTVDGISLTVAELGQDWFEVSLIPETLARTTLGFREVGSNLNLEADILAKHIERLMVWRDRD